MSKKKKKIGNPFLESMKDALDHAQTADQKNLELPTSPEENFIPAENADTEAVELNDYNRLKEQTLDVQETQDITDDELRKELKRFLIPKLRSASYRWSERSEAIKAARKSRGVYGCAICKTDMKNGEFVADHINPVVPFEGWDGADWTTYINRMFVGRSGFQIICKPCHEIKTDTEVQIRKMYRMKKKNEIKD